MPCQDTPRLAGREMKCANERDSARGWCAVEEINMRAGLARATPVSSSFTLVSPVSAALAPSSFCSSLPGRSSTTPACCSPSLFLSRCIPAVPFASGGDIYTRINPAARTRVSTYIAAGPGHLVISVTSRTFRSERQLTCNCGANGCSRMHRA